MDTEKTSAELIKEKNMALFSDSHIEVLQATFDIDVKSGFALLTTLPFYDIISLINKNLTVR